MKLLIAIVFMATLAFADDVATVRGLVEKFNAAAHAGDEATLKSLLGEGLVYVHSLGAVENKSQCIAAIVKTKPNFVFSPGWTVSVHDRTAIVHAKAVNNPGTSSAVALDLMQTWSNDGKTWRMVGRHTSRPPAK